MKHLLTNISTISILLLFASEGFSWDFLFSNKNYSDRITVQARIASHVSLSKLMANKDRNLDNVPKETNRFLKNSRPHLFIRIKNHGNASAWGKLSCNIDNHHRVKVDVKPLGASMSLWSYHVIPIKSIILADNDDYPIVSTEWLRLYSK